MDKAIYQSKTLWGGLVFFGVLTLVTVGWLPEGALTTLLQNAGGLFGLYGLRDAI